MTYVNAKMELTVQKKLQFKQKPLSMVSSRDGKYLYILFEGKLLVYSLMENKGQYTISLDKNIDKITLMEKRLKTGHWKRLPGKLMRNLKRGSYLRVTTSRLCPSCWN